jgi:hypothetical protein
VLLSCSVLPETVKPQQQDQQKPGKHGFVNGSTSWLLTCGHEPKEAQHDSLFILRACWSSIACTADDGASTAASLLFDQLEAAAPSCTANNSGSSAASLAAALRRRMLLLTADTRLRV